MAHRLTHVIDAIRTKDYAVATESIGRVLQQKVEQNLAQERQRLAATLVREAPETVLASVDKFNTAEDHGLMSNCKTCHHAMSEHSEDGCDHKGCRCMVSEGILDGVRDSGGVLPYIKNLFRSFGVGFKIDRKDYEQGVKEAKNGNKKRMAAFFELDIPEDNDFIDALYKGIRRNAGLKEGVVSKALFKLGDKLSARDTKKGVDLVPYDDGPEPPKKTNEDYGPDRATPGKCAKCGKPAEWYHNRLDKKFCSDCAPNDTMKRIQPVKEDYGRHECKHCKHVWWGVDLAKCPKCARPQPNSIKEWGDASERMKRHTCKECGHLWMGPAYEDECPKCYARQ